MVLSRRCGKIRVLLGQILQIVGIFIDLYQRGALRTACGLYGLLQVCAAVWLYKITLHCLGDEGEIGRSDADADLRQTLVGHIAADLAIALVVPQQHNQRQPQFTRAHQFRQAELHAAIASDAHHGMRLRQSRTDGGGQGIAQSAITCGRIKPSAWARGGIDMVATVNRLGGVAHHHRIGHAVAYGL